MQEPLILATAYKHGLDAETILAVLAGPAVHVHRLPRSDGEFTVVVGHDALGRLVEVGYVSEATGRMVVIHAMTPPARKWTRRAR